VSSAFCSSVEAAASISLRMATTPSDMPARIWLGGTQRKGSIPSAASRGWPKTRAAGSEAKRDPSATRDTVWVRMRRSWSERRGALRAFVTSSMLIENEPNRAMRGGSWTPAEGPLVFGSSSGSSRR